MTEATTNGNRVGIAELELRAVCKQFGGLHALEDVSFSVAKGKISGLIGPNGAGKTTLFNIITGVLPATSGEIRFRDQDITKMPPHRITKLGMARTFQNIRLFSSMTVMESIFVAQNVRAGTGIGTLIPLNRNKEKKYKHQREKYLNQFSLWEKRHYRCRDLSYADQRRMEMARALATEPSLLLLDEPSAGMNETETAECCQLIRDLNAEGLAILLIEHDMSVVMGCSDQITVLNFGKKIAGGTAAEIQSDPDVIEAYLGKEDSVEEYAEA